MNVFTEEWAKGRLGFVIHTYKHILVGSEFYLSLRILKHSFSPEADMKWENIDLLN